MRTHAPANRRPRSLMAVLLYLCVEHVAEGLMVVGRNSRHQQPGKGNDDES